MKKYTWTILIILFVFILLLFAGSKEHFTSKKFYLEDNLYNQKQTEILIKKKDLILHQKKKENFIVFFSMPYCSFDIPCETVFNSIFKESNTSFYSIPYSKIKKTSLSKKIKYAPTIAIFKRGKLIAFLDPNSDADSKKYESKKEFKKWLSKYIYLDR